VKAEGGPLPKARRLALAVVLLAVGLGGIIAAGIALTSQPTTLTFGTNQSGEVDLTMQTVGSFGSGDHPTWVSYLTQSPQGQWEHTTIWQVPAHTRINVTIYQYDSGSPLRNQQLGQVTGTIGEDATLNGKTFSVIDSNTGNGVGHTFSIPTLGISVPLFGNDPNANLCAAAPCTSGSGPSNVIKFSFMSPGPGTYPWQCFVPCGLGWIYGNGGPMQTVGYMGGFMKVA
jgi:hypothetical protein